MLPQPKFTPEYLAYLESAEWRARRAATIEKAGGRCMVCNGLGVLQAHHKTYANLGHEEDGDLIVLCVECHRLFTDHKRMASPPVRTEKAVKPVVCSHKSKKAQRRNQNIGWQRKNTKTFLTYLSTRKKGNAAKMWGKQISSDIEFRAWCAGCSDKFDDYAEYFRRKKASPTDMGCLSYLWGQYLKQKKGTWY